MAVFYRLQWLPLGGCWSLSCGRSHQPRLKKVSSSLQHSNSRFESIRESNRIETFLPELECSTRRTYLCYRAHMLYQWRNDGVAAASNDGGPTAGRGSPTVLEFLVINFSVCLVLLSNCYIGLIIYWIHLALDLLFCYKRHSDRLARSSKFRLISAGYLLF